MALYITCNKKKRNFFLNIFLNIFLLVHVTQQEGTYRELAFSREREKK